MSADNWAICPICKKENDKINAARIMEVGKKYGVVPAAEYVKLAKEIIKPIEIENSMREDYDIGTDDDGVFEVSYSCFCTVCEFKRSFKHTCKSK